MKLVLTDQLIGKPDADDAAQTAAKNGSERKSANAEKRRQPSAERRTKNHAKHHYFLVHNFILSRKRYSCQLTQIACQLKRRCPEG